MCDRQRGKSNFMGGEDSLNDWLLIYYIKSNKKAEFKNKVF